MKPENKSAFRFLVSGGLRWLIGSPSSKRHRWSRIGHLTAGVAIVGAGLLVVPSVAPSPRNVQVRAIRLVDTADSPLGDGTALVFGPSGVPIPPPQYVDAADTLYLQQLGFTGTAQCLECITRWALSAYRYQKPGGRHVAESGPADHGLRHRKPNSRRRGEPPESRRGFRLFAVRCLLAHHVELQAAGVPSDDVHFVLVGDSDNPNGGFNNTFDFPAGNTSAFTTLTNPSDPRHHLTSTRPTSTPSNTTVSPTSRTTRPTCCRTSTPSWDSF